MMPSATTSSPPTLPTWKRPPKTTTNLDWAEISIIDLSIFDSPGGKEKLAEKLRYAVQTTGFFSVTGTGFTEEEVTRQFSIGQAYFNRPLEEKNKPELKCDFGKGNYFGYRPVSCNLNRVKGESIANEEKACEKKIQGTEVLDNIESVREFFYAITVLC